MTSLSLSRQLIEEHLQGGNTGIPGSEIFLKIDQTLTQDATGTLVMQELEALELDQVATECSVQYVDHNIIQTDHRNADDHHFLLSACERFACWYSRAGNGVSHPLHMQHFGRPGATLLGSDSHTCAAGSLGMLAIGAGGLEVALAMAGEAFALPMPRIRRVELTGKLPEWCSAKDVILSLLKKYDVVGGIGWIHEYRGTGLACLSAMDRHVIANMGAEMGCTSSVFPADDEIKRFLARQGRAGVFKRLAAESHAQYDDEIELKLSTIEPLIALPSSPGNVVSVREVAGKPISQAYLGSSANPGLRDFAIPALMVREKRIQEHVSFDINPPTRQDLAVLSREGWLADLIYAGGRIHQAGCNGCIGMGQAPATGRISLRTVPRNFSGRSGTREDSVYLCSPETATASALKGEIYDPRDLGIQAPIFIEPHDMPVDVSHFQKPSPNRNVALVRGPNIGSLPILEQLPLDVSGPVLLRVGDDVSTDDILPAGGKVLPLRSNIAAISKYCFSPLEEHFSERADQHGNRPFFVVAGRNYGQGSSREHAALAPYHLGLRVVIAKSYARIHHQNLINFGIIPLVFEDTKDYERLVFGQDLHIKKPADQLRSGSRVEVILSDSNARIWTCIEMSDRQRDILIAGGLINLTRLRRKDEQS